MAHTERGDRYPPRPGFGVSGSDFPVGLTFEFLLCLLITYKQMSYLDQERHGQRDTIPGK